MAAAAARYLFALARRFAHQFVVGKPFAPLSVAVSGVAGPGGGTADKPVGRVHIAASSKTNRLHKRMDYGDLGRSEIRRRTVVDALTLAQELLRE